MSDTLVAAAIERDVVIAEGSEAATFLHGQLSQDIEGLAVGASGWSLLLEPQGKVVALLRVTRADDQRFLLDVDLGWGDAVITRLERFKLRTDCTLNVERWPGIAWRGPGADAVEAAAPIVAAAGWSGTEGIDVVGPEVVAEPTVDAAQFDALRIVAGWPLMGSELDQSTIPAAAGIVELSVSFTKGCYTGQELVARIDSRGSNTPTRLVRVHADDPSVRIAPGTELMIDDVVAGTVTSAATVAPEALAYVKRAVEVPGPAAATSDDGRRVSVSLLP